MLEIKNLSKSYVIDKKAVNDVNISIEDGEIFAFIGHNGAGKTTVIKCICGILDFEEGEILINGKSIKKEPISCKKEIAYIPDNPDLYEALTGIQYLNFIGDIYLIEKEQRNKDIIYFSELFSIKNNLNDMISTYSHGMKQKLAIISAFIRHPKLMLLDEPFVGLDPKAAYLMKEEMKKLCENGTSIFFSTHVLEVAEKLCDHVAIIKDGEIIASGTMSDVKGDKSLEAVFLELEG
ncbi:MAG: ABC transporter ATP-binding protein [Bacilli bacterium]|jgi:ABC-2 type transport system ATP-binding protein|nr:ABC transporter ATP-binding protein [Bacilli bacterium]MDD2682370.1 ABC transporter ATP-binding protein [Bacilli bacterium]MDD3121355.1 ABC transporter ATP-binding protein [Bacilli bacterium]MDD4063623.1 ABC transporter ATP-binding protein [Bacilli bacterium]MDD4482055.1 ABC transporter ATP-binding protein [Bacilli bacterium]